MLWLYMYTIDDLDKRLNHMPGYYFRPTCSIFQKKKFNVCSMHVGVLNDSHPFIHVGNRPTVMFALNCTSKSKVY